MKKTHHFDQSLEEEKRASRIADTFYTRKPFSVLAITRFYENSDEHLDFQRADIDVRLTLSDNRSLYVSEKFRDNDYNDLLLEIYSKYPDTKGWIHKSKANRLAYFFPKRMFWIDKKALSEFCLNHLFPKVETVAIERLLSQEGNSLKVDVQLKEKRYRCILTQASNNTNGDKWDTICISVPFVLLDNNNIRYQSYRL